MQCPVWGKSQKLVLVICFQQVTQPLVSKEASHVSLPHIGSPAVGQKSTMSMEKYPVIIHEPTAIRTARRVSVLHVTGFFVIFIWDSQQDYCTILTKYIQLDPANLNAVISNSPLFRTQKHFPWICPSVIYYWLFRTILSFSWEFKIAGVQLYNKILNSDWLSMCLFVM
jgi:hypothetical protein